MVRGDDFSRASQIYLHLCCSNSHTTRTRLRLEIFAMTRLSRTQRGKLIYSHKQILQSATETYTLQVRHPYRHYVCTYLQYSQLTNLLFLETATRSDYFGIQAMQSILKQQFQTIIQLICIHVYIVNIYIQYVFEVTSQ